jgi:hypothetical protein
MTAPRVPLYDRLPEIYRIRDAEGTPPGQLRAFLAAVEQALSAVHENIEALYDDFFIDSCDDWVVPYIADLLGTTHLKGDPRTLRADVADTVALRRRKGTRVALERLAADLTGWPCRCVELFEHLAWSQHLNHQRPDAGGLPPLARPGVTRFTVPRGGTVPVRDPAMLSLIGTPFDPFAYLPDVKRADDGAVHPNLPNLAIFLWRLAGYRLPVVIPRAKIVDDLGVQPVGSGLARYVIGFDLDPLDRPVRLFNTYRAPPLDATGAIQTLTAADAVPGPILPARVTTFSEAGNPSAYVTVDPFDDSTTPPSGLDVSDTGLQLFVPDVAVLSGVVWTFRGDNLCAWENGLRRPIAAHEIIVDPDLGRVMFGVAAAGERDALVQKTGTTLTPKIFAGYTYGAVPEVGAHPISRGDAPTVFAGEAVELRTVTELGGGTTLQAALAGLQNAPAPVVIEIEDSLVHDVDPTTIPGSVTESGLTALRLARSLVIRAASGERPTIRLAAPLAFRPMVAGDPSVERLTVRFEGVFITRDATMANTDPLIARLAAARLELDGCTLDPGGWRQRDGSRAPLSPSLDLRVGFGFASAADLDAFEPTPDIVIQRSITGALGIDDRYTVTIESSIVDAGRGVGEPGDRYALTSATDPVAEWGAPLDVRGAHFLGRVRVAEASGSGGLFVHRLEVRNNQRHCLKYCYFSGDSNRLPPNHACVTAPGAELRFTSTWFGDPGYGQLARGADFRIRNRGPGDDAMGAFGFLLEGHRWTNLAIRLREFMPVGVRPLPIAVT